MREIGDVVSRFNRFIVCRSTKKAKSFLGKTVYSEQKNPVGLVVDIFGPIEKPYLKILRKNGEEAEKIYLK